MTRSCVIVTATVELLPPASPDQPRNLWSTDGTARFVTSAELGYRFERGVVTTDPTPSATFVASFVPNTASTHLSRVINSCELPFVPCTSPSQPRKFQPAAATA